MSTTDAVLDHRVLDGALSDLLQARHWYVGFSGGVDSTVLLHLLQRWRRAHGAAPPLSAIHVNHGLQASAADWEVHCQWLCRFLQVPFIKRSVSVQGDSEAAAREARYRAFEEQLGAGEVLFLGHHLDDQVETFFLRLMRGAGVQGLAAIPPRRDLGQGLLSRPLLQVDREALESYAREHSLEYVEDPSNQDTAMDRNFLRARLLPLLASRWPAYRRTVARASEHMAGAIDALEQLLPAPATVYNVMGDPGLELAGLFAHSSEAASIRLRHWLRERSLPAPDQVQLEEFLRQLRDSGSQRNPQLAYGGQVLQRFRDRVYLLPPADAATCTEAFTLSPGETYEVPGAGQFGLEATATDGLQLAADERLRVDWRRGGERCRPRGRSGSNSLKKLLQEHGVPPWWRDRVPLLYLGEELLAVGDLWLCDSSRWREAPGSAQAGAHYAERGTKLWRPLWQRPRERPGD